MKYIFSVFLFAILTGLVHAQVTIEELIAPEPGDSVVLYVDPAPAGDIEITEPGGDAYWVWTLSDAIRQVAEFDTNDRSDLFPFADTKVSTAAFDNYYDIREDGWLLSGQVGQDPFGLGLVVSLFYQPAFREYFTPVSFGDSLMQSFDLYTGIPLYLVPDSILGQLPLVPDSMRARIVTQTVDKADAWGVMNINNGEAEVLRMRQEQRVAVRVEIKISILPWTDVTDLLINYLDVLPFEINLNDTLVSYRFLSPGYVLPLAQLTLDSLGGVGSVTYQQPIVSSLPKLDPIAGLNVYPNPARDVIFIDYDDTEDVQDVQIYDMNGRQVKQVHSVVANQIEIPVSDLASGLYLVSVWNSTGVLRAMKKISVIRSGR